VSWLAKAALGVIRGYQLVGSPYLGRACRFAPTCSEYARQAIRDHGALQGGWLAFRRILRCQPLSAGGYDPPPPAGQVRA
jgi:uncharacterized protein